MGRKRTRSASSTSSSSEEARYWRRKFRKLEKRFRKRTRSPSVSSSSDKENGHRNVRRRKDDREDNVPFSDQEQDIYVVHSDDGENQTQDPLFVDVGPPLSRDVLDVLGKDTGPLTNEGEIMHSDIAVQWTDILVNGLSEEVRTQLRSKYPPRKNCPLMNAPRVNPEAKAASTESALTRDEKLQAVQIQLGASLAALGKGLTLLLGSKEEERGGEHLELIEIISNASRLLSDLHHQESEVRKVLLNHNFNKDLREVVLNAKSDSFLFGENLGERIKAAKAMEKSGEDLKIKKPVAKNLFRGNLNSKGPLKRLSNSRVSGQRQTLDRSRVQRNYLRQDHRGRYQAVRKQSSRFRKDYQ